MSRWAFTGISWKQENMNKGITTSYFCKNKCVIADVVKWFLLQDKALSHHGLLNFLLELLHCGLEREGGGEKRERKRERECVCACVSRRSRDRGSGSRGHTSTQKNCKSHALRHRAELHSRIQLLNAQTYLVREVKLPLPSIQCLHCDLHCNLFPTSLDLSNSTN